MVIVVYIGDTAPIEIRVASVGVGVVSTFMLADCDGIIIIKQVSMINPIKDRI